MQGVLIKGGSKFYKIDNRGVRINGGQLSNVKVHYYDPSFKKSRLILQYNYKEIISA